MSDLISREALIKDIHALRQQVFMSDEVGHNRPFSDKANIIECINNQPATYDVDKVVEQLESFADRIEPTDENVNTYFMLQEAIGIVKGADKDE